MEAWKNDLSTCFFNFIFKIVILRTRVAEVLNYFLSMIAFLATQWHKQFPDPEPRHDLFFASDVCNFFLVPNEQGGGSNPTIVKNMFVKTYVFSG